MEGVRGNWAPGKALGELGLDLGGEFSTLASPSHFPGVSVPGISRCGCLLQGPRQWLEQWAIFLWGKTEAS